MDTTRREVLAIAAGGAVALKLQAQGAPQFFTAEEFRLVDELTEIIIPADAHSPGSRAALVASYIDARLAEDADDEPRKLWRGGLAQVGKGFWDLPAADRKRRLENLEKSEDKFFADLKARTIFAYYSSRIGIHQEMEYKGNTVQKEFSGYEAK